MSFLTPDFIFNMVTVLFSAACRSNGGNVDTVAEGIDCSVNAACDAEKQYTGSAKQQRYSRVVVAAECFNRIIVGIDVHCFYNNQIVVKRDYRIDQSNEYQHMEAGMERSHEDKELGEEACERRYSRKREQAQGHEERELGVCLIETVVFAYTYLAAVLFHRIDNRKCTEVGCKVYKKVEHQGCHALGSAGNYAEHEVACLRNCGERHESFDVVLAKCKEVGNGN